MEIRQLISDMKALDGRMKAIHEEAKAAGRDLTRDEDKRFQDLFAQFDAKEQALLAAGGDPKDEDFWNMQSKGRRSQPWDSDGRGGHSGSGFQGSVAMLRPRNGTDPRLFLNLFPGEPVTSDGWDSPQAFFKALFLGQADQRFRPVAAQREDVGVDGGFAVPSQFLGGLLDGAIEDEVVRPRSRVVPLKSNVANIPLFDYQDNSAAVGGFAGRWMGEGQEADDQTGKVRNISMRAKKLGIWSKASNELLEDSSLFQTQFLDALRRSISWYMDLAMLAGTGVSQPRGALNDPSLVTVSAESGQGSDTFDYLNATKMLGRLHPACLRNAVWVCNPSVVPELLRMAIRFQNAAGSEFVGGAMIPVQAGPDGSMTLLTRPVLISEKLPQLGDLGDVILADFSQYIVAIRRVATVQTSQAAYWSSDEAGFRIVLRVDGFGTWSKPFQPKNGPTLGWCVALEAR